MACSHGLFLDSSGGVLRLVQLSPLPYIKMEHGLSLGGKLCDLALICKKQFIKFFIKQRIQRQKISVDDTREVAV